MYCNFFVVKANNYSDDNNNNYLFLNVGTILINVWGDIHMERVGLPTRTNTDVEGLHRRLNKKNADQLASILPAR
jgi:hypothetical protein